MEEMPVPPARPGSWEAALHRLAVRTALLIFPAKPRRRPGDPPRPPRDRVVYRRRPSGQLRADRPPAPI
jgi:hypothetical protein